MATKLGRKELPAGYSPSDFTYQGRPARDQGDFGTDVGLADAACVNQIGECNNAKYYHGGVVKSKDGKWWVYLEWGRMKSAKSWNGSFGGGDFMFVQCDGESDARSFFKKQMSSKNTARLEQRNIGGKTVWTSKSGDDGYLVQRLATREKGLPDAYGIKDNSGVQAAPAAPVAAAPKAKAAPKASMTTFQPQVIQLAQALVGGTRTYTRSLAAATGVTPTMDTIEEVRNEYIPLALKRIAAVGNDVKHQVLDADLVAISKAVAALVPRPIPRTGLTDEQAILNSGNILVLQQDLDAFESALRNESFDVAVTTPSVDPTAMLNANLTWLDPKSVEWARIISLFLAQTNNRHSYLRGAPRVMNLFKIDRPDRDAKFMSFATAIAAKRQGRFTAKANLQPAARPDLSPKEAELYGMANIIFTQHGTRSVNVSPIVSTHFRLPRQLSGVPIAGANFGHGTYTATDFKKAVGYTSYERSAWGGGGGAVTGRGAFMFLCDTIMGQAYVAPSTGSWITPPNGCDSVFGRGGDRGHCLENDEHVVFEPHYNRIRYLVEFTF